MRKLLPAVLLLAACANAPDADVRDVRPTQMERDDKITVELRAPLARAGAPTTVTLDQIAVDGAPLKLAARAVGRDGANTSRVLFDVDGALQARI